MRTEFDPAKDAANRAKHGMPLGTGQQIIAAAAVTIEDLRFEYGERRFIAFGYVGRRLHVCVFTVRDDATRIISVRKANERERAKHG